jgi:hypothetical protein
MGTTLVLYQLLLSTLVVICLLIHVWWPNHPRTTPHRPRKLDTPRRQRSKAPTPFTGFLHKPRCAACAQGADDRPQAPGSPPPLRRFTRGRRRTVNPQAHCCPEPECASYGRLGRGHLRANGHPGGLRVAKSRNS